MAITDYFRALIAALAMALAASFLALAGPPAGGWQAQTATTAADCW